MRTPEYSERELYWLKLNAVMREPAIEKIAKLTGRCPLELYDKVQDIRRALVDGFTRPSEEKRLVVRIQNETRARRTQELNERPAAIYTNKNHWE